MNADDYKAERDNQQQVLIDTAKALADLTVEFQHSTKENDSLRLEVARLQSQIAELESERDTWRAVASI